MSDEAPLRKSLREFDYFAPTAPGDPTAAQDGAQLLQNQDERRRKARQVLRRRFVRSLLSLAAFLAWGSLAWGYRHSLAYAFSWQNEPRRLGDVTTLTPEMIPHNTYVSVSGITGHRGVKQKGTMGLSFTRHELWFIELAGSQGVFIEAPSDPARFGAFTEVRVSGRAIDPRREACCDAALGLYAETCRPLDDAPLRVIQTDVRPRDQWLVHTLLLLVGLGLLASSVAATTRLARQLVAKT